MRYGLDPEIGKIVWVVRQHEPWYERQIRAEQPSTTAVRWVNRERTKRNRHSDADICKAQRNSIPARTIEQRRKQPNAKYFLTIVARRR